MWSVQQNPPLTGPEVLGYTPSGGVFKPVATAAVGGVDAFSLSLAAGQLNGAKAVPA